MRLTKARLFKNPSNLYVRPMVFDRCDQFVTALKLALICLGVKTAIIKYFRFLPKPLSYRRRQISRGRSRSSDTALWLKLLLQCYAKTQSFLWGETRPSITGDPIRGRNLKPLFHPECHVLG